MQEADVVLTLLPQATGSFKRRPALLLRKMPPFQDFLVCGISTQLRQEVKGFDEIIYTSDNDFNQSGLISDSLFRLGFLTVLPGSEIIGSIDSVSIERHQRLLQNLSDYLVK